MTKDYLDREELIKTIEWHSRIVEVLEKQSDITEGYSLAHQHILEVIKALPIVKGTDIKKGKKWADLH